MSYHEIFSRIGEQHHVMIGGSTGSGKSVVEKGIIYNLAYEHSPEEIEFWFIDPKQTVLHRLLWLPHVKHYADNDSDALLLLDLLDMEMRKRNRWCQENDVEDYPGKAIYCFIDETADVIGRNGKEAIRKFQLLLQMARSANIHMIFCSQCFDAKMIPSHVACNITCTVGLYCIKNKPHISRTLVGNMDCCKLPKHGKAILVTPDDYVTVDIPMYSDDDWDVLRNGCRLRRVV